MPPRLPQVRGVLLDLWNTVAFSEFKPNPMLLIAEALGIAGLPGWKKTLEAGMMTSRLAGIREGLEALERFTGREIRDEAARGGLMSRWRAACAATRLYEDALPALRALRGLRLRTGILSNTQSFGVEFLRTSGAKALLDAVCLSCDLGRLKPDPLAFAAAAGRLGLPPGEILMVGDSVEDDVLGAIGAGLAAAHLDRAGEAPAVPGAVGAVRTLTEIPSWFS